MHVDGERRGDAAGERIVPDELQRAKVKLPERSMKRRYDDYASIAGRRLVVEKF